MLLREIPFLRLLLPLATGIAISGLIDIPVTGVIMVAIAATILIISSFLISDRWRSVLFGITQTIILITTGYLLYYQESNYLSDLPGDYITIECIARDYPEESGERIKFEVDATMVITSDLSERVKTGLIIYADTLPPEIIVPGNNLTIRLKPLLITNNNNPGGFNYQRYMKTAGVKYVAFVSQANILEWSAPQKLNLKQKALITRERMSAFLESKMPPRQTAIVTALFLGNREMLESDQTDSFAGAGAMHIMAVSGLHAGIISIVAWGLLFFLGGRLRFLRVLLTIAALWGFAYLTGLGPSVRRASIMFTLFHVGQLLDRPANNINTLLASAFIILVSEPGQLFSTGFQMSYLAVLSLLLFFKPMAAIWRPGNRIINYAWQLTVVSILAQGATAAVSIAAFNRFPVWFLITNLAVIPLAFLLVTSSVATFIASPVPFLSDIIAHITSFSALAMEKVTFFVASLPGASVTEIGTDNLTALFLTLLFFLFADFLLHGKRRTPLLFLTVLLLALLIKPVKEIPLSGNSELVVYATFGSPCIGIRSERDLFLLKEQDTICAEAKKHALTFGLKRIELLDDRETSYYEAGDKMILKTTNPQAALSPAKGTAVVCYTGNDPLTVKPLPESVQWVVLQRRSLLSGQNPIRTGAKYHFLNEDGCFRYQLRE